MQIKRIAIIGLGALGVMYAEHFSEQIPSDALRIIADEDRIERYNKEGFYSNGKRCQFSYVTPAEEMEPADLILITVKNSGLRQALTAIKNQVGPSTIIMSAINGITSEDVISEIYGKEKVLYCVAQGMDAVKEGNRLIFANKGLLCFGEETMEAPTEKVKAVADFFDSVSFPYEVDCNMRKRQWGKFMLNVGVNQTVAVYQTNYHGVQRVGEARDTMIAAMREVMLLSQHTDTPLDEVDLAYWLDSLDQLHPEGKPSMRQDVEAKRPCEVELFSGTVLEYAKRLGISTPVNEWLFNQIADIELSYN